MPPPAVTAGVGSLHPRLAARPRGNCIPPPRPGPRSCRPSAHRCASPADGRVAAGCAQVMSGCGHGLGLQAGVEAGAAGSAVWLRSGQRCAATVGQDVPTDKPRSAHSSGRAGAWQGPGGATVVCVTRLQACVRCVPPGLRLWAGCAQLGTAPTCQTPKSQTAENTREAAPTAAIRVSACLASSSRRSAAAAESCVKEGGPRGTYRHAPSTQPKNRMAEVITGCSLAGEQCGGGGRRGAWHRRLTRLAASGCAGFTTVGGS